MSEESDTSSSDSPTSPPPGHVVVAIDDHRVEVSMVGGGSWEIPLGPVSLAEGELASDPPRPAELTNALGFIHDYFDDIVSEAPMVLGTPSVSARGPHARSLAHVELGRTEIPPGYRLQRPDADEVFRTLVAEPAAERLHNPGLDPAQVDNVIGTLCILLAIARRLDLSEIAIETA